MKRLLIIGATVAAIAGSGAAAYASESGNAPDHVRVTIVNSKFTIGSNSNAYLRMRMRAKSSDGAVITKWMLKSRKPSGLRISKTGIIRGKLLKQDQTITVIATDSDGVSGRKSFPLDVQ